MTVGSTQHIILFLATVAFMVLSCLAVAKMPRIGQDILIVLSVLICMGAIFFRYAMRMTWTTEFDLKALAIQMLQVCNFNFILLPLMLIPKFKIARQYSIFFSMFAASTTLFALNSHWADLSWYHPDVLSSWISHSFAMICPLWMFASGRLRPERKYVLPVSGCVFGYFGLVYIISEILKANGIIAPDKSFSYIYHAQGAPIISNFYEWIGIPFWYLLPAFGIVVIYFYLFALIFTRKVTLDGNGGLTPRKKGVKALYGTARCKLKLKDAGFEKKGSKLLGWSESPDGAVKYATGEVITLGKKGVQLYAVWSDKTKKKNKS